MNKVILMGRLTTEIRMFVIPQGRAAHQLQDIQVLN